MKGVPKLYLSLNNLIVSYCVREHLYPSNKITIQRKDDEFV